MGVSHAARPKLIGFVLVTQKLCPDLPRLRRRAEFDVVREAIRAGNERPGFRIVAFSVLSNHLHYVIEAQSTAELSRGAQGLAIRIAKNLNRLWQRKGRVFLERFHARLAQGMHAIRRSLVYVLQNARKHGLRIPRGEPDPYSSGPWFRHWRSRHGRGPLAEPQCPPPVLEHADLGLEMAILWGKGVGIDDVPADKRVPLEPLRPEGWRCA